MSAVTLSGFADEALVGPSGQAALVRSAGLAHLDLRRLGPVGVLAASPRVLGRARASLAAHGVRVACLATGLGKVALSAPLTPQTDDLRRAFDLAHRFGTRCVRVFSWFSRQPDADLPRVLDRLVAWAGLADAAGVRLLHENETGVTGALPAANRAIVDASDGRIGLIFDPANYVQCGVRPVEEAWPLLADAVVEIHAKDARAASGRVVPCGHGDAAWPGLASRLAASGWEGVIALEPHLGLGGRGGPVTAERWRRALGSLQGLLGDAGVRVR